MAFRRSKVGFSFSRRTAFERTPNTLAALLTTKRASGEHVLDLTVSNPTQAGLPSDHAELAEALAAAPEAYEPEPRGTSRARRAVVAEWATRGVAVALDRVALTASTSDAYACLFKLFCDPGDEILVARPSYPLLDELARYEGVRLVDYALAYDGAWHIDLPSVVQGVSERTRAIIVVSPNNPTGSVLSADEHRALLEFGLPIICDEVFSQYPFAADAAPKSALQTASCGLTVVLDGLSKAAALPQMKVGWMTFGGERALVDEACGRLDFLLDAQLSVNGPAQAALSELLAVGAKRRQRVLGRVRRNLRVLDELMAATAVTRLRADAGWYSVLRLPAVLGEAEWVGGLLEEMSVWVQPGWFFDFPGEPHCVVSLLTPEREFERGVQALLAYVERQLER